MEHIAVEEDNAKVDLEVQRRGLEEIGGHVSTNIGNASRSSGKRKRMGKNKGVTISYMSELYESALSVKPPPVVTIKEAVELICKMQDIRAEKILYYFALNHIKDKNNREIFMNIPEEDRIWWIKSAFENMQL